jgi:hypothetical protein
MANARFVVPYPEKLSRGLLLLRTLLGWLYVAIPHGICMFFIGLCAAFAQFIAFWVVLFTGQYPRSLFEFVVNTLQWQLRVAVYMNFLTDEYPPFSMYDYHPAEFIVEYPERLSRAQLLARLFFGWLYILIPHGFCLEFRLIAHSFVTFVAWWVVLFTGKMPEDMHRFLVGTYRWQARLIAYTFFLTDEYPPFSGQPDPLHTGTGVSA